MDTGKLVGILVGFLISALMIGLVFAPTISGMTEEHKIYENDGTPFRLVSEEENPTIVISMVDSKIVITVDDEIVENPDFTRYGASTIVYGESGYIRLNSAGAIRGFADSFYGTNVSASNTVTITFESENVILTSSDATPTYTVPINPVAYIGNGSYVQTVSPYVAEDTIYIGGTTDYAGGTYISYIAYGTINDLTTTTAIVNLGEELTVTDVTSTVNDTNIVSNLYKINNVGFVATLSDETQKTATFDFFIAPKEISYDNPAYVGSILGIVFDMLPLVAGVGLLMIGVVYFITRQ